MEGAPWEWFIRHAICWVMSTGTKLLRTSLGVLKIVERCGYQHFLVVVDHAVSSSFTADLVVRSTCAYQV
uniref:Secreted protein n=1 Tax=Steinernema glaseri TaxID=37863 RepID=A0A1I7YMB4_9BILA